ncbi:RNA-binding protein [Halobacteriales archaeon QS_9_70_65]|nr:MAG: RNA-binding protein [Halobacteriales archaeon QS_9_70_65]
MHPTPDPDAMASAMAVAILAESVDTDATIQYPGKIRRSENRAFEAVLECEFDRIVTDIDLAADEVVLVDHNEPRGFTGADGVDPYAVVDHHPGDGEGRAFTDVRPGHGSCSSILAEYLADRGHGDTGDRPLPSRLATGLLYGIQSDTTSFTRGCVKSRAIRRRRDDGGGPFLVSHVGSIGARESLSAAADELIRLEGITAVVVTGEKNGELHASGRSQDDRVHMGKTLEVAFDDLPDASFGGHSRMGGGRVSLPGGGRTNPPELATDGGSTELHAQLFAAMNGEL